MKKLIFFTLLISQVSVNAQKQVVELKPGEPRPLVLVNGFETDVNSFIMDMGKIRTVDVVSDSAKLVRYGKKAKAGAIIIKTEKIDFMRLNALLNRFHMVDSLKTLRVLINGALVSRPELLLFEESSVEKVEITESNQFNTGISSKPEKFINIKTKYELKRD